MIEVLNYVFDKLNNVILQSTTFNFNGNPVLFNTNEVVRRHDVRALV